MFRGLPQLYEGRCGADPAVSRRAERKLVRLVGVTVEEEDVAPPNRACEEDRGGSVEKGALGPEGVISDDELALTAVEGNAVGGCREGKSSARGR